MNLLKIRNENVVTYTVNKVINNSLYITIQNGEVIVNAPYYAKQSDIQNIIEEKREWILNKVSEYKREIRKITSIKQIKVLGIYYNVEISYKNINSPVLDLDKETVKISIPNKLKKQNREVTKLVIDKMYNMIAEREIERSMEKIRKQLKFAPEDYEISNIQGILGECKNNKIKINKEIVKYRREVIDYIVLHEYCHLKFKTHTKGFYELIKKNMQNYEEYANEVNNYKY